jgi:hypothetical protein
VGGEVAAVAAFDVVASAALRQWVACCVSPFQIARLHDCTTARRDENLKVVDRNRTGEELLTPPMNALSRLLITYRRI